MLGNISKLIIVRVGNNISFSSLKTIGNGVLESFHGRINQVELSHHNAPVIDAIDAQFLTMVLHEEFGGHTLVYLPRYVPALPRRAAPAARV